MTVVVEVAVGSSKTCRAGLSDQTIMSSCPLPDNPALRQQMKTYLPMVIQVSLLSWAVSMLYLFSSLAYPHKAYLFHFHTVSATVLVVLLGFSVLSSIQASSTAPSSIRRALLNWHRIGMLGSVVVTTVVSTLMVFKKGWMSGSGWLLLDRSPSYHSWMALFWMLVAIPLLCFSGMVVHQEKPPRVVEFLAKTVYGSLGLAKKNLRGIHRYLGVVGWTIVLGVAVLGLTEKNEDSSKRALAYCLMGIWMLMISLKYV